MTSVEYQIVINRPLLEVLSLLESAGHRQGVQLAMPAGGYRFEVVKHGTRITLIGDPSQDSIHALADSLVRRVFSEISSAPSPVRPAIEP